VQAPEWFLKELKAFDPELRLRWSPRLELWQLERRVRNALHPGTIRNDGWHDDHVRAADGYLLVGSVPPGGLGRHIFERLRDSDLWSQGGWKRVADQLDEFEATEEARKWAKIEEDNLAMAREVFEIMKLRDGRTIFSAGFPGVA
jgi:hypothetical protein